MAERSFRAGWDSCPRRRFEVLNFAVAAYSPMQRLETLRRKVLAFHPDLVIYSATTLDIRLMEIHLCDMLGKQVDLKYDFLREATALAASRPRRRARRRRRRRLINKDRLKSKLRPYYWGLYDRTLGAIAAECRSAGVPLVMVIIPRVGKADAPPARAEPVARLKAIAAHQGLTVFDLSDTSTRSTRPRSRSPPGTTTPTRSAIAACSWPWPARWSRTRNCIICSSLPAERPKCRTVKSVHAHGHVHLSQLLAEAAARRPDHRPLRTSTAAGRAMPSSCTGRIAWRPGWRVGASTGAIGWACGCPRAWRP